MNLDRSLTHAEFVGDDLVGLAGDDEVEHLSFAVRQFLDTIPHGVLLFPGCPFFLVGLDRFTDAIE